MYHQSQKTKLHSILLALTFLTFSCVSMAQAHPWEQIQKIAPSDGAQSDWFGASVAMDGNLAVIGSYLDDDNGTDSGSAYVFDITTGQQLFKLLASDGSFGAYFGFSVAINGNLAVIGAKDDSEVTG